MHIIPICNISCGKVSWSERDYKDIQLCQYFKFRYQILTLLHSPIIFPPGFFFPPPFISHPLFLLSSLFNFLFSFVATFSQCIFSHLSFSSLSSLSYLCHVYMHPNMCICMYDYEGRYSNIQMQNFCGEDNFEERFSDIQMYSFGGRDIILPHTCLMPLLPQLGTPWPVYQISIFFRNPKLDLKRNKNTWHAGHMGAAGAGVQGILFEQHLLFLDQILSLLIFC